MTGNDLRQKYLDFFKSRGHAVIPSAPLVPENDPTTLFTSSGMQPLIPYLLGEKHPSGNRLVDSQKSFRSQDIDEVGDNRHTTFFEMLGNWSLGDYFKAEQLPWFFEFLTKELGLPKEKLAVTCFEGNDQVGKDTVSAEIWKSLGIAEDRIFFYPARKNWWSRSGEPDQMPAGEPGGPDSEVFYEFTNVEHNPEFGETCHPNCDCGRFLEIGNSVFMQYVKQADGSLKELTQKNVDFGGGLERILASLDDQPDVFRTDLFWPIVTTIEELTGSQYLNHAPEIRIIADHLKAATLLINDGVFPSNKAAGYVLRRLIRRAIVKTHQLNAEVAYATLAQRVYQAVGEIYRGVYLNPQSELFISGGQVLLDEVVKFEKTLKQGLKVLEKQDSITGKVAFDLLQTYGFPWELTVEIAEEKGQQVDMDEFKKEFEHHQDLSRTASKGMFKGGLADNSETVTKYHTATHLLHESLRRVLGTHVGQMGSNITGERLRFDFTQPQALTDAEIKQVEDMVNQQIAAALPVTRDEMTFDEAREKGALAFFGERYGARVSVYSIGSFSKEVCGGPHVSNTSEIGPITIYKQESIGAGKRRLYAKLRP